MYLEYLEYEGKAISKSILIISRLSMPAYALLEHSVKPNLT